MEVLSQVVLLSLVQAFVVWLAHNVQADSCLHLIAVVVAAAAIVATAAAAGEDNLPEVDGECAAPDAQPTDVVHLQLGWKLQNHILKD